MPFSYLSVILKASADLGSEGRHDCPKRKTAAK